MTKRLRGIGIARESKNVGDQTDATFLTMELRAAEDAVDGQDERVSMNDRKL